MTTWTIESQEGQIELSHKMWEWTKEFLGKDRYEMTAWLIASQEGQIELVHKLRE